MLKTHDKLLECVDVSKAFYSRHGGGSVRVLRGLSCELAAGEVVGVVGLSGSGKTTLLRAIAGLTSIDRGSILVDGKRVEAPGPDRVLLFQEETLLPWRRVLDNIALGSCTAFEAARKKDAADLLERIGLGEMGHRWPRELSGGERRRAELARALAARPQALLLDEPFASLDAATRRSLYELVAALWEERHQTVLFTTHDLVEAAMLADRILLLSRRTGTFAHEEHVSRSAVHLGLETATRVAEELYGRLRGSGDLADDHGT